MERYRSDNPEFHQRRVSILANTFEGVMDHCVLHGTEASHDGATAPVGELDPKLFELNIDPQVLEAEFFRDRPGVQLDENLCAFRYMTPFHDEVEDMATEAVTLSMAGAYVGDVSIFRTYTILKTKEETGDHFTADVRTDYARGARLIERDIVESVDEAGNTVLVELNSGVTSLQGNDVVRIVHVLRKVRGA